MICLSIENEVLPHLIHKAQEIAPITIIMWAVAMHTVRRATTITLITIPVSHKVEFIQIYKATTSTYFFMKFQINFIYGEILYRFSTNACTTVSSTKRNFWSDNVARTTSYAVKKRNDASWWRSHSITKKRLLVIDCICWRIWRCMVNIVFSANLFFNKKN